MLQAQIEENLNKIQQNIQSSIQPHKTISLFYTTIKCIQKEHAKNSNNSFSSCFSNPFISSSFLSCNSSKKYACKIQDLFSHFMDKNKKIGSLLDKVNSHMLKVTTQMILNLNEKRLNALYKNPTNEQGLKSESPNNRIQRVRSLSQAHNQNFQFSNNYTETNEISYKDSIEAFDVQKIKNKLIDEAQKLNVKASRLSQKTNESTSSIKQNVSKQINDGIDIKTLINLYNQHKLDQSHKLLIKIQNENPSLLQSSEINEQQKTIINAIKPHYQQMLFFYKYFDLTGYKLDKKEDKITMYYKILEKQNLVAIQVQSQVDISLQKFLCISSEIQLYDKYVPFNYQTTCLRQVSRNTKIGRSKVFIPLLNNRQAYFQAKAYDRLKEQNCIFLFSKNLKREHLLQLGIQYKSEGLIDLDYIFFLLSYTPITRQKGIVRMATCVDLKINILPKFILNKTARMFAFDYFKNMININKKFQGSAWEKAIKNNPDHYGFFREKISQYFAGKQQSQNIEIKT